MAVASDSETVKTVSSQVCEELLLTSADQPHLPLTAVLFDGSNWTSWRIAVEAALFIKAKDRFIYGTFPAPSPSDPNFRQWKRLDALVLTWLHNSIAPDISRRFIHSASASSLWTDLNECYGNDTCPQILMLKRRIANFTQNNKSVTSYYSELKMLWNHYTSYYSRSLRPYPTENSDFRKLLMQADDEDLLIQFLMGLNECYLPMCNVILIMKPLPSVSTAFDLIRSCESLRGIIGTNGIESSSNLDKRSGVGCTYCKKTDHTKDVCYQLANKNSYCDFCKKTGHVKANCFQLTGVVPEWYKALGDKRKGR